MKTVLITFLSFLITGSLLQAQDKVFLLNGDTVDVFITANPRKETNLDNPVIGNLNDYGFKRVIILFKPDSLRLTRPGQIKGYFRAEKGPYLGAGYFFSRELDESLLAHKEPDTRKVFLQRVNFHKGIIIWYYREHVGNAMPQSYFFIELDSATRLIRVNTYQEWKKWVKYYPPLDSISSGLRPPKKGRNKDGKYFAFLVEVMEKYKKQYP